MKNLPPYDWDNSDALDDDESEFMDTPALQQSFFENDTARQPLPRLTVSIPVDLEVIAWFRAQGPGWEKRMAMVLRAFVENRKANKRAGDR